MLGVDGVKTRGDGFTVEIVDILGSYVGDGGQPSADYEVEFAEDILEGGSANVLTYVEVTSDLDEEATEEIELLWNGEVFESGEVTLEGGEQADLSYPRSVDMDDVGSHTVRARGDNDSDRASLLLESYEATW